MAWTVDTATQIGRAFGILGANEKAENGLLTQRYNALTPEQRAQFDAARQQVEAGNMPSVQSFTSPSAPTLSSILGGQSNFTPQHSTFGGGLSLPSQTGAQPYVGEVRNGPEGSIKWNGSNWEGVSGNPLQLANASGSQATAQSSSGLYAGPGRNEREIAIRRLGYTGDFGNGLADAWGIQKYGSRDAYESSLNANTDSAMTQVNSANSQSLWNTDSATQVGRSLGLLSPTETATGGILTQRYSQLNAEQKALFDQIRSAVETGKASPANALNYLADQEEAKIKNDPSYGSLAKPAYKPYEPFSMAKYEASPDYKFQQEEGQKAIDRAAAARGSFYSGGALKQAAKFGSELAKGDFGNAYNRYVNDFNVGYGQAKGDSDTLYSRLAGLTNAGLGATNTAVTNNQNNANALGNIYGQVGNAQASSALNKSNTLSQILSGAANIGISQYNKGGSMPWQASGNVRPSYLGGGYY